MHVEANSYITLAEVWFTTLGIGQILEDVS